jgi:hypothetical protein
MNICGWLPKHKLSHNQQPPWHALSLAIHVTSSATIITSTSTMSTFSALMPSLHVPHCHNHWLWQQYTSQHSTQSVIEIGCRMLCRETYHTFLCPSTCSPHTKSWACYQIEAAPCATWGFSATSHHKVIHTPAFVSGVHYTHESKEACLSISKTTCIPIPRHATNAKVFHDSLSFTMLMSWMNSNVVCHSGSLLIKFFISHEGEGFHISWSPSILCT